MINTSSQDSAGNSIISNDTILDVQYVDVESVTFGNPAASYTGYPYDGLKRNSGVVDESDAATWHSESPSSIRGSLNSFPERVFIITDSLSINIVDADNLILWMRFIPGKTPVKVKFEDGYLAVSFSDEIRIYSFVKDIFWHFTNAATNLYSGISNRNSPSSPTVGHANYRLQDININDFDFKKIMNKWLIALGQDLGLCSFDIHNLDITDSAASIKNHDFSKIFSEANKATLEVSYWGDSDYGDTIILVDQVTPWDTGPIDITDSNIKPGDLIKITSPITSSIEYIRYTSSHKMYVENINASISPFSQSYTPTPAQFTIYKPVLICKILPDGNLIYSAGHSFYHSINSWYEGSSSIDVYTEKSSVAAYGNLPKDPFSDTALLTEDIYVASKVGVILINESFIDDNKPYEIYYSDSSHAKYPSVLNGTGSTSFSCVAQDPESGNILFSSSNKIYEVQPVSGGSEALHKLVRTIEVKDSSSNPVDVTTLSGFRNPNGIPEV